MLKQDEPLAPDRPYGAPLEGQRLMSAHAMLPR